MKRVLKFKTKVGLFFICRSNDGRFHPVFKKTTLDDSLGSYETATEAVEDLANNETFAAYHPVTSVVLDTSKLRLPHKPEKWWCCG